MCQGRRDATGARGFGVGDHGWWVASGSLWKHGCVGTAFFHAAQPGKDGQAGDIRWRQPTGKPRRRELSGAQRLLPLWAEKVGLRPGRLEARRAWARACAQKRGARPSSRNRTSDLRMSTAVCAVYSPPLYQLSYRRVHTGRAGSSGFVQMAEASSRGGPRPEGARSRLSVSLCLEVALPCPAPPCPALPRPAQSWPAGPSTPLQAWEPTVSRGSAWHALERGGTRLRGVLQDARSRAQGSGVLALPASCPSASPATSPFLPGRVRERAP